VKRASERNPKAPRVDWESAPMVFVPTPPPVACPVCDCRSYKIVRSMPSEGDGSKTRRCVCENAECGSAFLVVVEENFANDWQSGGSDSLGYIEPVIHEA
jgi:hypothetical protein